MRDNIKYIIKHIMRFVLRIFWVFPIQNRIFFMSTMGKSYSCNPKYIYESMQGDNRFKNYKFVWCFIDPKTISIPQNDNLIIIKKGNYVKYFYYLLSSRIVVYNCGGFSYAPIRKQQFILETWHGAGAYKRINLSVENKSEASKSGVMIAMKQISAFVATSKMNTDMVIRPGMGYKGRVINSGFPRNDILFNATEEYKNRLKEKLKIASYTKIVLYAPTFKGSENNAVNSNNGYELIDAVLVKKALKERFGGEWVFATRGHQYAGSSLLEDADYDWTEYPDMQELLLITDALITDYSSSIWDYALTGKPCFLYTPDLEDYVNSDRGFYMPIDTWPAIKAGTNKELISVVQNFNPEKYREKVEKYLRESNSYEQGKACDIIKDYIYENVIHPGPQITV